MTYISGSIPALITPMHHDESINHHFLEEYLNWHNQKPSEGVVILGSTGEALLLNTQERQSILKSARAQLKQTKMIVGISAASLEDAKIRIEEAHTQSADALLISTPYYIKPSQSDIIRYYEVMSNTTTLPIIMYTVPARTGVDISNDTIRACANIDRVVGIKDAVANRYGRKQLITELPDDFSYLGGDDEDCLNLIKDGGNGVISVVANAEPELFHGIIQQAMHHNKRDTPKNMALIKPFLEACSLGPNPSVIKHIVACMWKQPNTLRQPLSKIEAHTAERVNALLENSISIFN
ncbi:MAG: 4-hydroxy-tetrahydrodipicolinate synthase [Pseudomonadota bacterium]|nr:4-hydroxy-tetrahydrodipicolinate synthase [Pseudomonadota bacterium]